ncbi:hypothetical protein D9613_012740 [Agrocybe pediades]|uniref:Uncharacterized protein n=1 Tax=Agrocybe pediades TaxID=84607 RepID=A0A8H4VLR5_9AGAR|nr:hypothetical protein D9613_012740 [Agrocybe pediades]
MATILATARVRLLVSSLFLLFLFGFWAKISGHGYTVYNPLNAKNARPNAAIFILLAPSRITQALVALQNIEDRFNRRLKYPIILFTAEDEVKYITDEVRAKASWITDGKVSFETTTKESWEVPSWMDESQVRASMENIGFSFGYRAMCRYYSGFFWKHPALAKFDWLWRLDTDIQFHCDIPYDPIQRLIEAKALYGFVQINYDVTWVQPSLASNVSSFMHEHRSLIPADANLRFVWKDQVSVSRAMAGVAGNDDWSAACFYNNFEISHRSVWENEVYTKFFDYLERAGGFFYERWGDSPVHSYGLAMSLRKDQVMQFGDMGYQHQSWDYECPSLPRCACVKDGASEDFHDNAHAWFN